MRSIALGFWVRTGSRDETVEQAGISHLLEHLLFKGTDRFSSLEIDEAFDAMGAEVNAGTGKETTSVYARFLDHHLERAFDLLQDMVLRPAYPDIDSERQVVIEEIAMYEDEPADKVHDVLAAAVFGDHPLGRPVIGRAEVIGVGAGAGHRRLPRHPLHGAEHGGGRGGQRRARAHRRAGERRAGRSRARPANGRLDPEPAPDGVSPRVSFHQKETEQFHVCLGGPGIARGDERRFALRVLDTILGGSTSSRLFQEVREKRGLAYAVYTFASQYLDSGQVGLYVGTRPDRVGEALEAIGGELQPAPGGGRAGGGARAGAREREGAHHAVDGVHPGAHEPARQRRPHRRAAALARRGPGANRRRRRPRTWPRWPASCSTPTRLSAACVGTDEGAFRSALEHVNPALGAAA